MTADNHRNADGYRLVLGNCEEISVEAVILYRMILELVTDGGIGLAVVQLDVDDVGCRSVGDALEIPLLHCEKDILHSLSIEVARNEALPAECFDNGFVADFTDCAVEFKMLHCCLIEMCYSVPDCPEPHCTKSASAFKRPAKISIINLFYKRYGRVPRFQLVKGVQQRGAGARKVYADAAGSVDGETG